MQCLIAVHARLFICEKNVALHGLIRHLFLFLFLFVIFFIFLFFFRITIISCSLKSMKCTTVSARQLYFVRTALANAGTLYSDLLLPLTIYLGFHLLNKQTQSGCFTSLLG